MDCERLVARLLEEYQRRVTSGGKPRAEDFREEAGECYAEFQRLLGEGAAPAGRSDGAAEEFPREFGDYHLVEVLGRGGFGVVYRAVQRSLARPVALKVLGAEWGEGHEMLDRFRRGAQAAAQVEHDHVVRIHDYGVVNGRPFLAMNCLSGPTLGDVYQRLREIGPPPFGPDHHAVLTAAGVDGEGRDTGAYVRRLAALLAGPAQALDACHRRGIVHRDVKPCNLILDGGKLMLTDFDLVKRQGTMFQTVAGNLLGTVGYMSPEQWSPDAGPLDGRSDVYALGSVLYEGLVLRRPFEGHDAAQLMTSVLNERPADPRRHDPHVPAPAALVAMKCLETRPGDRYDSSDAFARDLRALAWGEAVAARPVPLGRRVSRWIWARKIRIAASAAALILATAWFALRPARLDVSTDPVAAEVYVDGRHVGRAPVLDLALGPGDHLVSLRAPGFVEIVERLACQRGVRYVLRSRTMKASDQSDPAVLDSVAERIGVPLPKDIQPRGGAGPRVEAGSTVAASPLLPRGAVRPEDLLSFVVDVEGRASGRLVVTRAGETIASLPFSLRGTGARTIAASDLRWTPGNEYEWHLDLGGGSESRSERFTVVAEGPSLDALRGRFHKNDTELAALIEAAALHKAGLHVAAYQRAMELAETWPRRRVFALAYAALGSMGLSGSSLGGSVMRDYGAAPG